MPGLAETQLKAVIGGPLQMQWLMWNNNDNIWPAERKYIWREDERSGAMQRKADVDGMEGRAKKDERLHIFAKYLMKEWRAGLKDSGKRMSKLWHVSAVNEMAIV